MKMSIFLLILFSAGLSGSDDFVLIDSLDDAYSQMFSALFEFAHKLNSKPSYSDPPVINNVLICFSRNIYYYY